MLKKKQILMMVSIVVTSFLLSSMFNMNFIALGGSSSPWDKVWTAVSELQDKVDSLNSTLTSRIEDLEGQILALQTNIANLQTQMDVLNARLFDTQYDVETLNATVDSLMEKIDSLRTAQVASWASNQISITDISWTSVPDMRVDITLNTTSSVRITMTSKCSMSGGENYIRAMVDSGIAHPGEIRVGYYQIDQYFSLDFFMSNVVAGSHSIEIQCRTTGAAWPIKFWNRLLIVTALPSQ